jgi:tetratricopeptide (TPR) repeat protein
LNRALLLLLALACACATAHPRREDVRYPPDEITVTPLDRELASKNDAELFAVGTAAAAAGDDARAAAALDRLADVFPGSPHAPEALLGAAQAHARREQWQLALERFRAVSERFPAAPEAREAAFGIAECAYHLGDRAAARTTLDAVLARPALARVERVRALAERGVVELEDGTLDRAEVTLRDAVAAADAAGDAERLDPYYPAQAQFYLGEVYRASFRAAPIDPSRGDADALHQQLERKAELLLSAQGHYLRTVRRGDRRWAVAAGARIGELYESLRAQLLDAPLPPGLDAAQGEVYRTELRAQVRVLASKAVTAYEEALSLASRAGVGDVGLMDDAKASLERLRAEAREAP